MKILIFILLLPWPALAFKTQKQAIYGGMNSTTYSSATSGVSYSNDHGLEAGYLHIFDFGFPALIRTGVGITQKNSTYKASGIEIESQVLALEVPVTAIIGFTEILSGFFGLNNYLQLDASCESNVPSCTVTDTANSSFFAINIGGHLQFTKMHGAEIYYEFGISDVLSNASHRSYGVRYVFFL